MISRTNISVAFILDHRLMNYRLPFFNMLAEQGYEVTVFQSGSSSIQSREFNIQTIPSSPFFFKMDYRKIPDLARFDIVVCMQNIRLINLWLLSLNPSKKYSLIHWGIGTSSASGLSLKKTMVSRVRNFLARRASAQVLYSDFPLPLFDSKVIEKTFIANNTIHNPLSLDLSQEPKDSFLFIGSLNKRKGLDLLIQAFASYLERGASRITKLVIIGSGPLKEDLNQWVNDLNLSDSVELVGNISDDSHKKQYFTRAIASISPLQAGLSVLESFSYRVPFICYSNAISGGEHLNIKNGENGYLINSVDELIQKMVELDQQPLTAAKLGNSAYQYYQDKRQMKHMVEGFVSSFNFVLGAKRRA